MLVLFLLLTIHGLRIRSGHNRNEFDHSQAFLRVHICRRKVQVQEVLRDFRQSSVDSNETCVQVPFKLADGRPCVALAVLPPGFPQHPPTLCLSSPVSHPWVRKADKGVDAPCLRHWGTSHIRLKTIFQEVISTISSAESNRKPASPDKMSHPQAVAARPSDQATANELPHPITSSVIASLSTEKMEKVLLNDEEFEKLYKTIIADPSTSNRVTAFQEVETLRTDNLKLAHDNISKQSEVQEIRRQIAIVRSIEYEPAKSSFEEKYHRQQLAWEFIAPEKLIQGLHDAACQAEKESVELEKQLLAGEITAEAFVERYSSLRIKYNEREMKHKAALQSIPRA